MWIPLLALMLCDVEDQSFDSTINTLLTTAEVT